MSINLGADQGLTQEQLAAKCCVIGFDLSRSTLAKIESQNRQETDYELRYFAKVLKVDEGVFFIALRTIEL